MIVDETAVEVRRRFRVAPEKVFAAFSEARWLARWLSPSPDIRLSLLQFEFHEGGAYRFAYHVPGGRPRLEYRPVRITNWQPQARAY